jgi:serine/threonine protein kinase
MLASKRFFELPHLGELSRPEFLDVVRDEFDNNDWEIRRNSIWTVCTCLKQNMPLQGWKGHLSAVPNHAKDVLRHAARLFIQNSTSFKFLSDPTILRMTHGKAWPRGSSGKFITFYPTNEDEFKRLLEQLYQTFDHRFNGPYVLSDYRYKDSEVIYYRYGGMRLNGRLSVDGRSTPMLILSDGREVADVRGPYPVLPDGVSHILPNNTTSDAPIPTLNDRYVVKSAIHFSAPGGVYLAHDNVSKRIVVVKEARAHVHHASDDLDAREMLRHEYLMLRKVQDCGIAPSPIEIFEEWEHVYLAEEYLEGYVSLQNFVARNGVLLKTRATLENKREYFETVHTILMALAVALDKLHSRCIVFGDLSPGNVLVQPDTLDVKLIDMEGARELGCHRFPSLFTPGFAELKQIQGPAHFATDNYAFGRIILFLVTHINEMLEIKPEAADEVLVDVAKEFGLWDELRQIVAELSSPEPSKRPAPKIQMNRLGPVWLNQIAQVTANGDDIEGSDKTRAIVQDSCRFIKAMATYDREDRLFPADGELFNTNPLSLAHGAIGPVYALNKIEHKVDHLMLDWIVRRQITNRTYPPGLSLGIAGIGWALLDLGEVDKAQGVLSQGVDHPLLPQSASLYHGAAGWGMANLRFWLATGDGKYVDNAIAAANMIIGSSRDDIDGLCWPDANGRIRLGLGYGATGVALFFLYLFGATGRSKFKNFAIRSLDYDIARAVEIEGGGFSWPSSDNTNIVSPYLENGSAGVGIACLRFSKVLGDVRYHELVEGIFIDCDRKYSVYPGRNLGLAGILEFVTDAYQFTNDERFRRSARRLAEGIALFAIRDPDGLAFPGYGPRISCDFGTGSAGIMLALDRLASGRKGDFMLDEILEGVS